MEEEIKRIFGKIPKSCHTQLKIMALKQDKNLEDVVGDLLIKAVKDLK